MRSWRPKPLCTSRAVVQLHHAHNKRAFRIRRYLGKSVEGAEKIAARYKQKQKPKPPAKDDPTVQLPDEEETIEDGDLQPPDLIRRIILGARREDNIAAYEQRHQRFLEALQKGGKSEKPRNAQERGMGEAQGKTSSGSNISGVSGSKKKATEKETLNTQRLRRRRSFRAQKTALSDSSKISSAARDTARGQLGLRDKKPSWQSTSENTFFNSQAAKDVEAPTFKRLGLWDRVSSGNLPNSEKHSGDEASASSTAKGNGLRKVLTKSLKPGYKQDRSGFDSVIADRVPNAATDKGKRAKKPPKRKPSLFEELFPEEAKDEAPTDADLQQRKHDLPKISFPIFDEGEDDSFVDEYMRGPKPYSEKAPSTFKGSWRAWNPSVLVLRTASPSLIDADFRRIAPKGQHISEWNGPGDYFKVIPGRDLPTLSQATHYFLIFPNPAYAHTYRKHVQNLHNLARTHTPTSIESPPRAPKGMLSNGQDIYSLLQEYTLVPPSQPLNLVYLAPPVSAGLKHILRHKGYPEITTPHDRTSRSVLFWVEGFVPTIEQVQQLITRDGRYRGMAWALMDGRDSIQQLEPDRKTGVEAPIEDGSDEQEDGTAAEGQGARGQEIRDYMRRTKRRWTISFEDENEARRFVRRWHLRAFSEAFRDRQHTGDHKPLVHAEFLW